MNADTILIRSSSLGAIMTEPKGKSEILSETCKTHLIDVYVDNTYNRFQEISVKQFEKGNEVEEDSITIISRLIKTFLRKNEERLKNEFIQGTPDLFIGPEIRKADIIRDAKSSWDAYSFFRAIHKKLNPNYYWQGMGYMDLSGAKECSIDYCLNNTPYFLVEQELRRESYNHPEGNTPTWIELQMMANMVYDFNTFEKYITKRGLYAIDDNSKYVIAGFVEIPLKERHFAFEFERNDQEIEKMHERVKECRKWMNENLFNKN